MNLRLYIAKRLVTLIARELNYQFSEERIDRIAAGSLAWGREGYATMMSTAVAFDHDLMMYGDPHAKESITGFPKEILDEIYGKEPTDAGRPK